MQATTGEIWPIFHNYKWANAFKNCESLHYAPETYDIVHQLCLS